MSLPRCVVWEPVEDGLEGHDLVRLSADSGGVRADGAVVAVEDGAPWAVRFAIECDRHWHTRRAEVTAISGDAVRRILLESDGDGHWQVDGEQRADLHGCLDVDLAATPFTNTLAIRRLRLRVGDASTAHAVWVGAPGLELEVLVQEYAHVAHGRYRYRVPASGFTAELTVDEDDLVVDYEGLARRVAG